MRVKPSPPPAPRSLQPWAKGADAGSTAAAEEVQANGNAATPIGLPAVPLHTLIRPTLSPQAQNILQANQTGAGRLEAAVVSGDLPAVKAVLAESPWLLNAPLQGSATALHLAARAGQGEVLDLLLQQDGIQLDPKDAAGFTPLHAAVEADQPGVAARLIARAGVQVNAQAPHGTTALLLAVQNGNLPIVRQLLSLGGRIDPNLADRNGITPLLLAVLGDHMALATLLLDHIGTQVEACEPPHHMTPLYAAIDSERLDMAELLLSRGANANAALKSGHTPLHNACVHGRLSAVAWLLSRATARNGDAPAVGLNLTARDGTTALQLAIREGHADVVAHLLRHPGVNPNTKDHAGVAPLHDALLAQHHDILKTLLSAPQTDHGVLSENGCNLLHRIAMLDSPLPLIHATQAGLQHKPGAFQALLQGRDAWDNQPVSLAAQLGKGASVIYELLPTATVRPRRLQPTTYQRGWLLFGRSQAQGEDRNLKAMGREAGIEMHTVGPDRQDLTWERLKHLEIQPGDFAICQFLTEWDGPFNRVMVQLDGGEVAPLVDVARMLFTKGVAKALFLGREAARATDTLLAQLRDDPTLARPTDQDGGYLGLEFTFVDPDGDTRDAADVAELFLRDCIHQRTRGIAGTALRTQCPQPMRMVGGNGSPAIQVYTPLPPMQEQQPTASSE